MRRSKKVQRPMQPDLVYNSEVITKFINQMMRKGKKTTARKIVYDSFEILKEKTKKDPLDIFDLALKNVRPSLEVRPKRIGGATYQVPRVIPVERATTLAIRWILTAVRAKKGKPAREKLAQELIDASDNKGAAIKKRDDTHRMAEANRAFAHFAW